MDVACSVYARAPLVDGRVNDETGSVDELVCAADSVPVLVDVNHVGHCEEGKMDAIWVYPEGVWLNGI